MNKKLDNLVIYTSNANWDLPAKICQQLGIELGVVEFRQFDDGEQRVRIPKSIRNKHLVIINENTPTGNLVQYLQIIDAATRADVDRITVCVPYFGWLRQDRQTKGREAINAKIVVNLLINQPPKVCNALSMDNHFKQATSLTDKPWAHIYSAKYVIEWIKKMNFRATLISPDLGNIDTVKYCANALNFPMGFVRKKRDATGQPSIIEIIRNDNEEKAIIIDDIAATFKTAQKTVRALVNSGVKEIFFFCPHAILAGDALSNINELSITKVVVNNTVYIPPEKTALCPKLDIISVHDIFAETIKRIHTGGSISSLFDPALLESH